MDEAEPTREESQEQGWTWCDRGRRYSNFWLRLGQISGTLLGLDSACPIIFSQLGTTIAATWGLNLNKPSFFTHDDKISERVRRALVDLDVGKLQWIDRGWRLSFEWEALQPQRRRSIRQALYEYSPESADLSIRAKVFADSFPEPLVLEVDVRIEAEQRFIDVTNLLPDWEKLLLETPQQKNWSR